MSIDLLCVTLHYLQLMHNKLTYFWVLHDDDDDDETDYGGDDNHHALAIAQYRCSHAGTLGAMLCLR